MLKKTLFFAGILLLYSCSGNKDKFEPPVKTELNGILKFEKEIKIEQKEGCFIGRYVRDFIKVGNVFLLNEDNTEIKAYNEEGKFLYKIGKMGEGPGEYISALRSIYAVDSTRFVISNYNGRMIYYNTAGRCLGEKKFYKYTTYGKALLFTDEFYYLHVPVSKSGNHIIQLDTSFQILKEYIGIEKNYESYFKHNLLYGSIHLSKRNILYEINSFSGGRLNILDLNTLKATQLDLNCGDCLKPFPGNSSNPVLDFWKGSMLENICFVCDKYLQFDFKKRELDKDGSYFTNERGFFTILFNLESRKSYLINNFDFGMGNKFSDNAFIYVFKTPITNEGQDSYYHIDKYSILEK